MSEVVGNVVHFVGLLRRAGISVGTGQVLDAVAALGAVGLQRRDDVFWALHAALIRKRGDHQLFAEAFDLFFRDPRALNSALALLLPMAKVPDATAVRSRRLSEAQRGRAPSSRPREKRAPELIEMAIVASSIDVDRRLDFEQMSVAEIAAAEREIARLPLVWRGRDSRRHRPSTLGKRIDLRRTMHASIKTPDSINLTFALPRKRVPPLVILIDVSASMERYSRVFLHFAHAVTAARARVHTFVFGTRLTNVSRALCHRDIDRALADVADGVGGARGGTRIATCLHDFNRDWARRTLCGGARVLLLTDGLERDGKHDLSFEADRLHRAAKRVTWLNPLLRWSGFEARASGIRALLPHVDDFTPVHNLGSLAELAAALST